VLFLALLDPPENIALLTRQTGFRSAVAAIPRQAPRAVLAACCAVSWPDASGS